MRYIDVIQSAMRGFVRNQNKSISALRDLRAKALKANAWENATQATRALARLLRRCTGREGEFATVARHAAREAPSACTFFELAEAEERRNRPILAASAYRRALFLAQREGDPDLAADSRGAWLRLRGVPNDPPEPTLTEAIERAQALRPASKAIAELERLRRAARRKRHWAVEQACLRRLVIACRESGDVTGERRWADSLARRYPTGRSFWLLGIAEARKGRSRAARAALQTARLLGMRAGDHDLLIDVDDELERIDASRGP